MSKGEISHGGDHCILVLMIDFMREGAPYGWAEMDMCNTRFCQEQSTDPGSVEMHAPSIRCPNSQT